MNKFIWTLLTGLIIVNSVSAVQGQTPGMAKSDRAAILSIIKETQAANNAGDVDRWTALFTDDAVYMPPNTPAITTPANLQAIAEAGFRHTATITIEPQEIQVGPDWAFARTQVTGQITVAGSGEVITVDSKQIVIYERTGDSHWKIARLISNSNIQ